MRVVIQKVKLASVTVDNEVISLIGRGLVLLVGLSTTDTLEEVSKLAQKVLKLRLFEDSFDASKGCWNGKPWAFNTKQADAEILSVSQFTLYANLKKGSKPDFHRAMKGEHALELYNDFLGLLGAELGETKVKDGRFGAMMDVALVNDGPVTIVYDTNDCLEAK